MVTSVGNSTTTLNTATAPRTTQPVQGATSGAASNTGVQNDLFGALQQPVGNGVASQASVAFLEAARQAGLASVYAKNAAGEIALTGSGTLAAAETQIGNLKTTNKNLQQEINTLDADLKLDINSYKNAKPDEFNGVLLQKWAKYDQDLQAADNPPTPEQAAQLKQDSDAVDTAKVPLQNQFDEDNAQLKANSDTIKKLQDYIAANSALKSASDGLKDALKPFDEYDTFLFNQRKNAADAGKRAAEANVQLSVQEQAGKEVADKAAIQQAGQATAVVEAERQLQQAVKRAKETEAKVKALLARSQADGETSFTPEELAYFERHHQDVLARDDERGNGSGQADLADDIVQGAGNSAQGKAAFVAALDASLNPIAGQNAAVAAQQTAHDNNPLGLTNPEEHFRHHEFDPSDPFAIEDGTATRQGVATLDNDSVSGAEHSHELVNDAKNLVAELDDLQGLVGQLMFGAAASSSRGVPFIAGDQSRVRILA